MSDSKDAKKEGTPIENASSTGWATEKLDTSAIKPGMWISVLSLPANAGGESASTEDMDETAAWPPSAAEWRNRVVMKLTKDTITVYMSNSQKLELPTTSKRLRVAVSQEVG